MTLPQIRLALDEADRAEAGAALLDLSVVAAGTHAAYHGKRGASAMQKLAGDLKRQAS